MAEGSPTSVLHLSIIRWIADNFYLCEGCVVPRWLLYELYMESCSPDAKYRVNSATFGKLIRLVFPGLGTRRLGKRGNGRYHYSGITIKENSSLYARYCSLLSDKDYHRHDSAGEANRAAQQLSTCAGTSGNICSSGDEAGYESKSKTTRTTEEEIFQDPGSEFSPYHLWEQQLGKKNSYEMVVLLANEYLSYCQDILHTVRKNELDEVQDCIMSFWRSLQPERIALMSLPDVCQLFKSYDRQLFKEIENILLHDFLEEVPVKHIMSIRRFSNNIQHWMLNALAGYPLPLQTFKMKEITAFVRRLGRRIDLSNLVRTVRTVLNSNSKVTVLQSELYAVINQGCLDVPGNLFQTKLRNPEELQNNIELKCLKDLMPLLAPSTDVRVLLNCVSSNLKAFVIQPSRSKEELRKLASDFQLRWNFLLNAVSKVMTLKFANGFDPNHRTSRREASRNMQLEMVGTSGLPLPAEAIICLWQYGEKQPEPMAVTKPFKREHIMKLIQVILEKGITKTFTKLEGKPFLLKMMGRHFFASDEQQIFRENQPDLKIIYAGPFLLFDTTSRNTVFILLNLRSFSGNTKCKTVLPMQ